MDVSKQKDGSYQENKRFLAQTYKLKEDFLRKYTKFYYGQIKAEKLYLQILTELEKAILDGNFDTFKKLSSFICYISDLESVATLQAYYDNVGNPIKNTNLVILACKHNQVGILKYLFTDQCQILNKLTIDIGRITILPEDKDATCHNAFYYAIRTSNVELINTLINNYFINNLEELNEILAIAYSELKLKNVPLSDEIAIFVESKLINLRFYSNNSGQVQDVAVYVSNIKERIRLVLDNIRLLNLNVEKVDEIFIFIAKFVAHNIHILKRQLKSTYDRLPWEEIEFCLIIFVASHIKQHEMNLFCDAVLNKRKILKHLENFAKVLQDERNNIYSVDICKFANLPKFNRDEVIAKIIGNCPEFEELYNDYQQIRDIHSLDKISNYIKLALLANPKVREGQLIITRTLQVIGEYFKNSLESPKLSKITSELLIISLPKNTRKVIIDLRNSLSHANSFSQLTEIEENADVNFFINIQIDIKKINSVITDMLYKYKIKTIRILLTKIINSESLDEIIEVAKSVSNVGLDATMLKKDAIIEYENIGELIKQLSDIITEKTRYENELFNKINKIIDFEKNKIANVDTDYNMGLAILLSLSNTVLSNIKSDKNIIRGIKYQAYNTLENITSKIESTNLKEIAILSSKISDSIMSRLQEDKLDEAKRLIFEIFNFVQFGIDNIKWIEELHEKLNHSCLIMKHKQKNMYKATAKEYNKQLTLKLTELKNILSNNLLKQNFSCYRNNKKLQAVVEMLVLDAMSILGGSINYLENNLQFLDENSPSLTGKSLRNYFAYGNPLLDVLSDPSIAIILNAEKLTAENIIGNGEKIGQSVNDDTSKLKDKYDRELAAITNQKKMFTALEEGNLGGFKSCLEKGADINARSVNLWTTLHFAAKGSTLDVIKFIVDQNVGVDVTNDNCQSPLHIAAAYGRSASILEFLMGSLENIGNVDDNGDTPLHIAAQNGHKDTVIVLLKNKANTIIKNINGLPPLHCALVNNNIDVVKVLLEPNVDINETLGGYTPLHVAAERGYLELVDFLIKNKANVNAKTDKNWTPLHAAAVNGHVEVVNTLILNGSVVNAGTIDGYTGLHYAVENGHEKIVDVLLKHGVDVNVADKAFKNTPLHCAAKAGYEGIVKSLLKHKADANVATVHGVTPLHFAALVNCLGIVSVLLEHGVDVNARNKSYNTPLHYAAEIGHVNFVELLLINKATVNDKDVKGDTPLHKATMNGSKEVINLLIKNEAKIDSRNNDGVTPIFIAAKNGKKDIMDLLIKNKANVNAICNDGFTPLNVAIIEGHIDVIRLLLKNEVAIKAADISDCTPLHAAVQAGHKNVVELLIENGANVNAMTKEGLLPLSCAVKNNHKELVKVLIENGANVNSQYTNALKLAVMGGYQDIVDILLRNKTDIKMKDGENNTILHLAAIVGHKGIVDALIRKGADVNALGIHNLTPIFFAADKGHEDIVELLILNGAKIHFEENPPLRIAAIRGHINVVEVLLKNGADINSQDDENRTALEWAVARDHIEVVKILLQHKDVDVNVKNINNLSILHIAAAKGNLEIIKCLVEKGADLNVRNRTGSEPIRIAAGEDFVKTFVFSFLKMNETDVANQTLLHYATIKGQIEIAEYLISKNVDLNSKDADGRTPLHFAASHDRTNFMEILLKNGAIYNSVDKYNKKPLEMSNNNEIIHLLTSIENLFEAVKQNDILEVKNCIQAGAIVNAKNCDGATPLHLAASEGYDEVVDVLFQNHTDINDTDVHGRTPLQFASCNGHLNVVKMFLQNKADVTQISHKGNTPLHTAASKGHKEIVEVLLEHVTNRDTLNNFINAQTTVGRATSLHVAAKNGFFEIVQLLLKYGATYDIKNKDSETPLNVCKNEIIINFLTLTEELFTMTKNGNTQAIDKLSLLKPDELIALTNARNSKGNTLLQVAIINKHNNIAQKLLEFLNIKDC